MFHALVLAVKILHFALLSALQNKPFRAAIADTALLSSTEKVKAQISLYLVAKKRLKRNYIDESYLRSGEMREKKEAEKKRRWERKEGEEGALVRKMLTPHFRGNTRKNAILLRFITLYFVTWVYSVEIKTQTSLNML